MNIPSFQGLTLAYISDQNGHSEVIWVLYKAGADIDLTLAENKMAPISIAVDVGSRQTVRTLAECGVD
nr:hypothetical protein [Legionella rowbothamii]